MNFCFEQIEKEPNQKDVNGKILGRNFLYIDLDHAKADAFRRKFPICSGFLTNQQKFYRKRVVNK